MLTTKLSAIGKYAYIVLSEGIVDFGEVTSGHELMHEVVLQNKSDVPTDFSLLRLDNDRDELFHIEPQQGVIPGLGELFIRIHYKALAAGNYVEDKYTFHTPGNCDALLTCRALSVPPAVVLSRPDRKPVDNQFEWGNPPNTFNFGDSEINQTESRIFTLVNKSKRDVTFSFVCDGEGVFRLSPLCGVITSNNETSIKVIFCPSKPMNFYRRVFILIEDSLPQFVDLMGSGYIRAHGEIKEQRPFPLRFAHVQAFRNRSAGGLGHFSADELDALYASREQEDVPAEYFARTGHGGTRALSTSVVQHPITRSGESTRTATAVAHEFFISDSDNSSREITLSKTTIDFGFASHLSSSYTHTVMLTNTTNSKVTVTWFVPSVDACDGSSTRSPAVFNITPSVIDVDANKSQVFSVVFSSKQSNRNFVTEAEVVVFLKNQRTFRLVNDHSMSPPWNLQMRLIGHTFASGQLLASVKLAGASVSHGKLMFPCAYVGESVFETIVLQNSSSLPAIFKISVTMRGETSSSGFEPDVFNVKPDGGQVGANGFVHICVRFKPDSTRRFEQSLKVQVNGAEGPTLSLEGAGGVPFLVLPDVAGSVQQSVIPTALQGTFYMQPTSLGLSTYRTFQLHNASRLPLRYAIQMPSNAANSHIIVSPAGGIIKGNQSALLAIEFKPKKAKRYVYKLQIRVYPIGGVSNKVVDARQPGRVTRPECIQNLWVNIVAPGDIGAITFTPSDTVIPVQLIHTSQSSVITLENITDAEIYYELFCEAKFIVETNTLDKASVLSATYRLEKTFTVDRDISFTSLTCDAPMEGLPARSKRKVTFSFSPELAGVFHFKVFAKLKTVSAFGTDSMLRNTEMTEQRLTYITGAAMVDTRELSLMATIHCTSSFPKILFEDIRIDSDCIINDAEQIWRQFSLSSLNYDLSLPITEEESRVQSTVIPDQVSLKRYAFNFTPKPQFSTLETVCVQIRNHGSLPASFHLHYPNEQELDLEPWVEEEAPSEEKLMQTTIIDKLKCFSIVPLEVVLMPNETHVLTLTYNYDSLKYGGIHRLPLYMVIDKGKRFFIDLIGHTLPIEKGYNPRRSVQSTKTVSLDHVLLVPFAEQDFTCRLCPVPIGMYIILLFRIYSNRIILSDLFRIDFYRSISISGSRATNGAFEC
jgi:hypothetical protein